MDAESRSTFFYVRGFSMWPLIRNGEIIKVRYLEPKYLKRGDILLYKDGQTLLCHRLVRKVKLQAPQFFVQCDSAPGSSVAVGQEEVLGKVVAVKRKDRFLILDRGVLRLLGMLLVIFGCYLRWLPPFLRTIKKGKIIKLYNGASSFYR